MANEKRLIDAEGLVETIVNTPSEVANMYTYNVLNSLVDRTNEILDMIDNAPTVDAVEVVRGRWVSDKADIMFHCSECETQISTSWDYEDLQWNYCPNCGAKMDGGADHGT